ncbi:MAG TPA: cytosine deaminase [Alphaproteobacteria bacterium]|nr:cytosine deaminase [Alphaproteobacteria bacterium]
MWRWPPALPSHSSFALRCAAAPICLIDSPPADALPDAEGLVRLDIEIADGRIARIAAATRDTSGPVDLDGSQVWPCFVDMHTHIDKGHIWPRAENPDGTRDGAIAATAADRERRWSARDVELRMAFALRTAYAHGTAAIRTHIDSAAPQHRISWPVVARMRENWRGRIELQAVTILPIEQLAGTFGDELADLVAKSGGILGGVALPAPDLDARLDRVFALAVERGLELDFHADESLDPNARALAAIAAAKLRHRFERRVVVGHCCSLGVQDEAATDRTLDLVAQAGVAVVSLPMCNLFLQDRRPGRTPRRRGVTLLHEMRARGIRVAVASDNCRDPFYAYGDHDALEVFTQATRIAHLDRPVGAWPTAVTRAPAEIMGLNGVGRIAVGGDADLVLFNARNYSELLSRPQADRIVLRRGRAIDTTPPSYRELDAFVTAPGPR